MYDKIRTKFAKLARAQGLPKIHKLFHIVPAFRPIIDTTGKTHYSVENDDYIFISLDVASLYTNVPLKKTVNIILKRISYEK